MRNVAAAGVDPSLAVSDVHWEGKASFLIVEVFQAAVADPVVRPLEIFFFGSFGFLPPGTLGKIPLKFAFQSLA